MEPQETILLLDIQAQTVKYFLKISFLHEVAMEHELMIQGFADALTMGTKAVAKWNEKVVAETDKAVTLEGNKYVITDSVKMEFFKPCKKTTTCPAKGTANYYDLNIDGKENCGCAWVYKDPKPDFSKIKGYFAFWNGVDVY